MFVVDCVKTAKSKNIIVKYINKVKTKFELKEEGKMKSNKLIFDILEKNLE